MSGRTLSRRQMLGWTAAAGAALLAACGGNAAAPASSAPAAGSGSTAASAAPASGSAGAAGAVPQSIDQLYEAAKKEANVTIWTPENPEPMQAMFADFNKRYPGIKLTYREQNTGSESVLLDIQSGKHTVDLSQSSMAVAQDLLNRNYLQTTGNWDKLFPDIPPSAIQSGGKLVAYFDIDFALGVNTKALGSTPEPASWDDVVKPDFNGRVVVDSRGYPFGLLGVTWGEQKFTDWMTKLKALQPKLLSGGTNVLQSLASGEAALGIGSFSFKILEAADTKKAPVKISKVSPVGVDLFVSSIPIDVPHPNAARLFAGWIATPEGQASHEKNVGTALLGPGAKSKPAQIYQDYGTQLLFETPENVQDEDKYNKLAQKILGVTA